MSEILHSTGPTSQARYFTFIADCRKLPEPHEPDPVGDVRGPHPAGERDRAHHLDAKADPLHMEWVYIIDETLGAMHVLGARSIKGSLVKDPWPRPNPCPERLRDGSWNYGNCSRYKHEKVCTLLLGAAGVIDWGMISRFKDEDEQPFDPNMIYVPEPASPERPTAFARILDDDLI